jgi:hypothetical protein
MRDLCVRETYMKDGEEKVSWNRIGTLIDGKDGKQYIKLFFMPGVLVSVFEQKKTEKPTVKATGWDE